MSRELPGGDLVSLDLQSELERQGDDEDPPCQCWQISEDLVDASFCPVHHKLKPAPPMEWECPQCGSSEGTPVDFDYGTSSETGYSDAGEACTLCIRNPG